VAEAVTATYQQEEEAEEGTNSISLKWCRMDEIQTTIVMDVARCYRKSVFLEKFVAMANLLYQC
jgi:hypothetical protein